VNRKKPDKRDKRVNDRYDEPQSVWVENADPEELLKVLLSEPPPPKPEDGPQRSA